MAREKKVMRHLPWSLYTYIHMYINIHNKQSIIITMRRPSSHESAIYFREYKSEVYPSSRRNFIQEVAK